MNINVGDIVRYEKGKYGLVVKYEYVNNEEDLMHVIFFHKPQTTYHFYLNASMKSCWIKVDLN